MMPAEMDALSLQRVETGHHGLAALCLRLEEAAFEMESVAAPPEIIALAGELMPQLTEIQMLEESRLFPDFDRHAGSCFGAMMIAQLKAEHRYDRLAAGELAQTLGALAARRCPLSPDTVASMMRGFAENLRRHMRSEAMMIETLLAAKAEGRGIFG